MRRYTFLSLLAGSLLVLCSSAIADSTARGIGHYYDQRTGLTFVIADIEPSLYKLQIIQPEAGSPVSQVFTSADFPNNYYDDLSNIPDPTSLKLIAVLRDKDAKNVTLTLRDRVDKTKTETIHWPLQDSLNATTKSPQKVKELFKEWIQIRHYQWDQITAPTQPNLLTDLWQNDAERIYGADHLYLQRDSRRNFRDTGEDLSDMGSLALFGGQVAVRETLQTQLLAASEPPQQGTENAIDVADIQAVEVQSHPYAEMLAQLGSPQAVSTLADYVPVDRFLILLQNPKQLANLLDGGDNTAERLMPLLGQQFTDYDLLERYAARFGLTPEQARQMFATDSVVEVAAFSPDIFFRDNTELTFIIRQKSQTNTKEDLLSIFAAQLKNKDSFFAIRKDDLVFFSTSKQELELAMALANNNGADSLGHSDEFQMMLHKLPITADTRLFVYFSDAFIRRLTGPEVKIGQYRRAIARQQMEYLTALALLYRLDHGIDAPDLETLRQRGYLNADAFKGDAFTLSEGTVIHSKEWGQLNALKTLSENPARLASPSEAKAYEAYRNRYSQFWQRYFDPIAVRLDWLPDNTIAVETFILPLIDNSLYNQLKVVLGTESPEEIRIPRYSEPAVATLAFRIPKKRESRWLEDFFNSSTGYQIATLQPSLDGAMAFSIRDSAPILQFPFPGLTILDQRNSLVGMRGSQLIYLPIIASLFTRDCDLALLVKDEDAVRQALRNFPSQSGNWDKLDAVYLEAENTLLINLKFADLINFELSVTLENGWLHISNHPWTPTPIIGTETISPSHASIVLNPSELKKGLPQALSRAHSAYRNSAYASAANLLPWMAAYAEDAPTALARQKASLGHSTPVPPEVQLSTDVLNVSPYGTWVFQQAPNSVFTDTGLLQNIQDINLWLRFEDDGLRTHVEFRSATTPQETP